MTVAALIWCPFPDEESAAAAASTLLGEGLIVCANLLPAMRSLYVWQGERNDAREDTERGIVEDAERRAADDAAAAGDAAHKDS